jgi:type I restriction enzyme S subunit
MTAMLPAGWVPASLGDICAKKVTQEPPGVEPVPYIDISSIDRATKRIGPTKVVTAGDAPTRARQWVSTGDVLVSMTRPNLNAVAQVGPDLDGAVASTGFDVLRPLEVDPGWVFYRVRTNEFVADVCEDLQGVVYPAIRPHDVRRHSLPLPPIGEQHRIVEAIESYLTRLDDAVATLERVQRNLKRYRASVLKAAVEGRLVPTEAELARAEGRDYEPASVLLERILAERRRRWEEAELAKMKAKGKAPTDDRWKGKYEEPIPVNTSALPELPEGWSWASMSALTAWGPQNGLYVPRSQYGNGTAILRIDDYQVDWSRSVGELQCIEISAGDTHTYGLRPGDIVINRVNSPSHLGKSLAVQERHLPAVFESNMMRFGLSEAVLPSYIQRYLSSVEGKARLIANAKWAVNQASINQQDVGATPVPLPPEREQHRIVSEVDRLFSSAEVAAALSEISEGRCARLRQSILKWAFEGRLVDQDPTDEPADVLLDRIRAEREAAPGRRARFPRRGPPRRGARG